MAKLFELLTDKEIKELKFTIDTSIEVKSMTIEQAKDIALSLIKTEYNDMCPKCFLSAEAMNILSKRAVDRDIPIFN